MHRFLLFFLLFPCSTFSQLRVAKPFSSDMILQRGKPIHIRGTGMPGEKVYIQFSTARKTVTVKPDSTWSVYFAKQKANAIPQQLSVSSGPEKISFSNILIGDIWVCSGQSNMEWPLEKELHFKEEKSHTLQPLIRLLNPPPAGRSVYGVVYKDSLVSRLNKEDFYRWDKWEPCDSNSARSMSAIAYYFAKTIVTSENIPIGIINLSIGGAPIETFISREALRKSPAFAEKVNGNWLTNGSLPEWIRERGQQNVGNLPTGGDGSGPNHAYKPGMAFDAGITPLLPFPVTGILWYQGESNSLEKTRVEEYRELLHLMINDYRQQWQQPDMPFYWVQLSSIDTIAYKSQYWPEFRDEQRKLLAEVKNSGMAVCSDLGFRNDVHPTNKKAVGERLARWALNKQYGKNITPSSPLPLEATYKNGKITISFLYTGSGLQTAGNEPLHGFSLGENMPVQASVQNNQIIIFAPEKPRYVYYGWTPFSAANLINADLLPASTFKIEVK